MYHTKGEALTYTKEAGMTLQAYSDASFEEWGATSGIPVMLAGATVLALSKRQRCVTLSTCHAELVAMSMTAAEVIYVRMLMMLMGFEQTAPTPVFVDNKAAETVTP